MDTTKRSTCWSLTINNPTEADEECICLARQNGWKLTGQKEVGTEGTPHLQMMLRTPQVRFSAVKKAFLRAHIEVAREPSALEKYVDKEEGRISKLPVAQEKYPSLSKFWQLIWDEINEKNGCTAFVWFGDFEWCEEKAGYPLPTREKEFNRAVGKLIQKGYHVETIAVNPATLTAWKRHGDDIMYRCLQADIEKADQAKRALENTESVSSDETQHAEVPVYEPPSPCPPAPPCAHWRSGQPPNCPSCEESARARFPLLHPKPHG